MSINLDNISSFEDFYQFLDRARSDVSFWGNRYVTAGLYSGSLPIDLLPIYTMKIVNKNINFDEKERSFGEKVVKKIDELYLKSEKLAAKKNCLTRLFFAIVEYWIDNIKGCGYGTRFRWDRDKDIFEYYTKIQYKKKFKESPTQADRRLPDGRKLYQMQYGTVRPSPILVTSKP